MASTTKKDTNKSKSKPRRSAVKKSRPKQTPNIQSLQRALAESVERAGLSYTVDCFKDDMKVMMRLKEPQADPQ